MSVKPVAWTPGPWNIHETASGWMVDGPDRMPVCSPASTKGLRPEAELAANAALICAAPELAEALRRMVGELKKFTDGEGCDHTVGVCWCETFRVLEDSEKLLARITPK